MKLSRSTSASVLRLSIVSALTAGALSGCYVVPLGQPLPNGNSAPGYAVAPLPAPAPVVQTFSARLYPSSTDAAKYGVINGTVSSDMDGRGHIAALIGSEQFQGDATRGRNSRDGVANAAGSKGGILNCSYTMNSSTLGSGRCVLNNGPTFSMHIGS